IYLVDELLSVGDEYFQAKCWKRLRERFSNGKSGGILVTHDWSAVLKLCETSYILDGGCIVADGPSEKMVQQYLQLPVPSKEYVELITPADGYVFESGAACNITFDIQLKKIVSLALSYSIELFRSVYGWEILLLHDEFVPLECKLGHNLTKIAINALPLVPGDYYLNIFLQSKDAHIDNMQLDGRSWTFGNGIKMTVVGEPNIATTVLPWKQQLLVNEHVTA
ncbi:sugar ABC transporter ATP-binding protein, partial [bacterium]|nr:sugar ABC transporter ATP-binding protein [bacterium]